MAFFKEHKLTTTQMIVGGFLIAILLGATLLTLPISSNSGEFTSFVDALFTSTSAVCVTGLTTLVTVDHWNLFGQIVIIILIQFGGLGVVTFATSILLILGKRITLQNRLLIQESYNLENLNGLVKLTIRILKGTFIVEGVGAFIYMFQFVPEYGIPRGIWYSIFHSISSFCNAGFDLIGNASYVKYHSNVLVNLVTMGLIISGGIGFPVWWDVLHKLHLAGKGKLSPKKLFQKLDLHSKIAITMTVLLIVGGAIIVFFNEYGNPDTIGYFSLFDKIMASFFQSITFRTAGYATIPQENLTVSTSLIGIILMFIGGSPSGTAGGIKTVTIAILLLGAISSIRSKSDIEVFERKILDDYVRKALAVFFFSFATLMVSTISLSVVMEHDLLDLLFESTSALATVGLSRALTPQLNTAAKIIIIITMYLGRIGPISMALALNINKNKTCRVQMPSSKVIVG